MWPFSRNPTKPDVDPGREELTESQRQHTLQYGWQGSEPPNDKDELRDSLERHEDDLSEIAERQAE